jgi:hypothetical protein
MFHSSVIFINTNILVIIPTTCRVMRYEDLSFNVQNMTREIFDFFRLSYAEEVEIFLTSHTKRTEGGVSSTIRDSKTAPIHWQKDLTFEEVSGTERIS